MLVALGLESIPSSDVLGWYAEIVAGVSGINLGIEPSPAVAEAVRRLAAETIAAASLDAPPSLLRDAAGHAAGVTPEEIAANAAVLLFGGIETTEGMLATLFLDLLSHPDQLELARSRSPSCVRTPSRSRCAASRQRHPSTATRRARSSSAARRFGQAIS